ncbi:hypothetical protein CEXT_308661 [Caerostris extrusa]|uniref:Uncharacterized protein n=1 Tax=Caerostris extrusa TaxID=172846 RepID=A0AAV4XL49_CAEEX|nr:hypothetical protein CEXT_308661 [Caerostris extrusa]
MRLNENNGNRKTFFLPPLPSPANKKETSEVSSPLQMAYIGYKRQKGKEEIEKRTSRKMKIAFHLIHTGGMMGRYPALSRLAPETWNGAGNAHLQSR